MSVHLCQGRKKRSRRATHCARLTGSISSTCKLVKNIDYGPFPQIHEPDILQVRPSNMILASPQMTSVPLNFASHCSINS